MKKIILTENQYKSVLFDRFVSYLLKNNDEYREKLEKEPDFLKELYYFFMSRFKNMLGISDSAGRNNNTNQRKPLLMAGTRPSNKCLNMISMFENGKPYPAKLGYDDFHGRMDGGHLSYGYGLQAHPDGGFMENYPQAKTGWTQKELDELYLKTVNKNSAKSVSNWMIKNDINLSQNQFDAVVSIVYNCGSGCLEKYKLFSMIAANPNDPRISGQWQKTAITSNGKVLQGLKERRLKEAALYQTGQYPF